LAAPDALVGEAADAGAPPVDAAVDAAPPPAQGPPPEVALKCEPNPVRIGEALVCTLVAVHRADVSIAVTSPPAITPEPAGAPEALPDGKLRTTRRFIIRPRSLRKVKIDGLAVIWTEATGGQGRLEVEPMRVPVKSVMGDVADPQFRTFETPQGDADAFFARHGAVPYRVTNWPLLIGLSAALVIVVGVGLGMLLRRWLESRRVEPGPPVDPRPAHVIAFEALEKLIAEQLPAQGRVDEYYVRLSEIVRAYLDRRFGFNALEMTSDEIREWARQREEAFSAEARLGLDDFLGETDLVKFADFAPDESAIETVTRMARGLIGLTRAPDVPTAPAPAAEAKS
ncbi:MAG: hypothetical protein KC620_25545, partial [Myxococcales bacterium]|nr:hypothetical protein [Myxococcales bacterium]